MKVAITVDVERDWGGRLRTSRGIDEGLPRILGLLNQADVKATFFVSGEIGLAQYGVTLRYLADSGHEIASHGYSHMNPNTPDVEASSSKVLLENELKIPIIGFRAPQFKNAENYVKVLKDFGYEYDSSFSKGTIPTRYNGSRVSCKPFEFSDGLREIPVSSIGTIPMGLRWINATGMRTFKWLMARKKTDLLVVYMHPFDIVAPGKNTAANPLVGEWYKYGASRVAGTLRELLAYFRERDAEFVLMRDIR